MRIAGPEGQRYDQGPRHRIFTIGHSTRTQEDFLALVRAHAVAAIADVLPPSQPRLFNDTE